MKIPSMEDLLEQGTRYDLTERVGISRRECGRWLIYFDGVEIHFKADSTAEPRYFDTVREALVYLQTQSGFNTLVAVGAEKAPQ